MRRHLSALFAVLLMVVGGFFVYTGINPQPEQTPDISENIYASPEQEQVGPTEADVDGYEYRVTAQNLKNSSVFVPAIEAVGPINVSGKNGAIVSGYLELPGPSEVTQWRDGAGVDSPSGNILITGHISYNNVRGVLYNLAKVKPGNIAYVKDASGRVGVFQLEKLESFKKTSLPPEIWSKDGELRMTLVTCGGTLRNTGNGWHFDSNIVATWKHIEAIK